MELKEHKKTVIENKEFCGEVQNEDLSAKEFIRVFAVGVAFIDVNFKQCDFSECYFRNCRFIRCDFTGANIKESNLRGSQFEKCKFQYTTWYKTLLDEHFLDICLPSEENLARDLARSLRVNFSQIGNYEAVNKAASIEVSLTGQHLYNAAYSRQSYYRDKYKSWSRIAHAISHARWKAFDLLWGNGESIVRVVISGLTVLVMVALFMMRDHPQLLFSTAFWGTFTSFWGIQSGTQFSEIYIALLTVIRFILFGLFMAILVKRLSRR